MEPEGSLLERLAVARLLGGPLRLLDVNPTLLARGSRGPVRAALNALERIPLRNPVQ
jgi:hypothetical protein